jgi:transposase InsO family protein
MRVVHWNVTSHPGAQWTAQQIIEAFPQDTAPKYMIRDRDGIFGEKFHGCVVGMGIEQVLTAPRSPWQNSYAERLVAPSVENASITSSFSVSSTCTGS